MQYVALIYQGSTPLPGSDEWNALSAEEQKQIYMQRSKILQSLLDWPQKTIQDDQIYFKALELATRIDFKGMES